MPKGKRKVNKTMVIIYLILALVVILFLFVFLSFYQAVHPPKYLTPQTPADFGWSYEDITLTTSDNLKLAAWFVPSKKANPKSAIILLHGYPADKGNLLWWAGFLHNDFNLLFFDFRYFGKSQGNLTSLGFYETLDVLAAVDFAKNRGIEKIGLMGFSFGAAVGLLTLSETDKISAIVADSAFANLDLIGATYFKDFLILKKPLTEIGKIYYRIFFRADPGQIAPEKKVKLVKIPIFLIHSRGDQLITFEHALKLKEALKDNPKAQFWFENIGIHGSISTDVRKEYENRILNFFKQNL